MPAPGSPQSLLLCRDVHHRPAEAGLGQGLRGAGRGWPHGPGYRARRARGPQERAGSRAPAQAGGFLPAPPHATRGRGARPPPAAGPHIVDDHRLVGDDVVGLHGRAGPAQQAGRRRNWRMRRRMRADPTAAATDAGPRPSRPKRAAYASRMLPGRRAPRPIIAPNWADDAAHPGRLRAKEPGSRNQPANCGLGEERPGCSQGRLRCAGMTS